VTNRSRSRLVVLSVLVVSLVATLLGRLWYLQVLAAPTYRAAAAANQIRDIVTEAPRGEVVDDEGRPFIDNKTALVVTVNRLTLLAQPDDGKPVLKRLAKVLHTTVGALERKITPCGPGVTDPSCWGGSQYQPIPVSQLTPNLAAARQALQILEMKQDFPGVSAQAEAVRNYPKPDGALASSILGYASPITAAELKRLSPAQRLIQANTETGKAGIEESYEKYLRGKPGVKEVAVDHLGAITRTIKDTKPVTGDTIVTTIDAKVQATLEKDLGAAVASARAAGKTADYAAGVVMNVRTGGIVGMASYPTYQPDLFTKPLSTKKYKALQDEEGHPLVDKAYQSSNPPGSTFKLISASGLIADGTASINGTYDCSQYFGGKHNFEDEAGFGHISIHQAIVVSCDTFFYRLALKDWERDQGLVAEHKPIEGVQAMARDYGVGVSPGPRCCRRSRRGGRGRASARATWIELRPQYCKGAKNPAFSAQHRADDEAYCTGGFTFEGGDQENEDIGQGAVLMSPLQLAVAYSALANGGTVYKPRVAKAILSPTGALIKRIKAPVRDHLPVSQATLDYIRSAMYGVVQESTGTAYPVYSAVKFPFSKVDVGGKTGTAELTGTSEDGSWFASFAGPAGGKPQYVTVIEIDKADQGAISAAPTSIKIWDALYGLHGQTAIFPNGTPPTALPKLGAAAATQHASTQHSSTQHSTTKHASTHKSPASPTQSAAGLPPALVARLRGASSRSPS
jgi:penicillin-binding protein 2